MSDAVLLLAIERLAAAGDELGVHLLIERAQAEMEKEKKRQRVEVMVQAIATFDEQEIA